MLVHFTPDRPWPELQIPTGGKTRGRGEGQILLHLLWKFWLQERGGEKGEWETNHPKAISPSLGCRSQKEGASRGPLGRGFVKVNVGLMLGWHLRFYKCKVGNSR